MYSPGRERSATSVTSRWSIRIRFGSSHFLPKNSGAGRLASHSPAGVRGRGLPVVSRTPTRSMRSSSAFGKATDISPLVRRYTKRWMGSPLRYCTLSMAARTSRNSAVPVTAPAQRFVPTAVRSMPDADRAATMSASGRIGSKMGCATAVAQKAIRPKSARAAASLDAGECMKETKSVWMTLFEMLGSRVAIISHIWAVLEACQGGTEEALPGWGSRKMARKTEEVPNEAVVFWGLRSGKDGARWRVRTSDPYRVKVVLYH